MQIFRYTLLEHVYIIGIQQSIEMLVVKASQAQ